MMTAGCMYMPISEETTSLESRKTSRGRCGFTITPQFGEAKRECNIYAGGHNDLVRGFDRKVG